MKYSFHNQQGRTELEKFATFFCQDWEIMFPNFYSGAKDYFDSLPRDRRLILRKELQELVESTSSTPCLQKAWFRLGAEAWQRDLEISAALRDFIWMLDEYQE